MRSTAWCQLSPAVSKWRSAVSIASRCARSAQRLHPAVAMHAIHAFKLEVQFLFQQRAALDDRSVQQGAKRFVHGQLLRSQGSNLDRNVSLAWIWVLFNVVLNRLTKL